MMETCTSVLKYISHHKNYDSLPLLKGKQEEICLKYNEEEEDMKGRKREKEQQENETFCHITHIGHMNGEAKGYHGDVAKDRLM